LEKKVALDFLGTQLDFILLIYGLSFVSLAAVSWRLGFSTSRSYVWRWLSFATLLQGLNAWTEMLSISFGEDSLVLILKQMTFAAAVLAYLEFGFSGAFPRLKPAHAHLLAISFLLAIAPLALGDSPVLGEMLHYILGISVSLLLSYAVGRHAETHPEQKVWARLGAILFLVCGLSFVLVGQQGHDASFAIAEEASFDQQIGLIVTLCRMVLVALVTGVLWRLHPEPINIATEMDRRTLRVWRRLVFWNALCLTIGLGWFFTQKIGAAANALHKESLKTLAMVASQAIDVKELKQLKGLPSDVNTAPHASLKRVCTNISEQHEQVRYVYLMGLRGGEVFYYVDAEPERYSTDSFAEVDETGLVYEYSTEELIESFSDGSPFVEGPVSDKWGIWISALAPVMDPDDGKVLAVIGIDISARDLFQEVNRARLLAIVITMCATFILLLTDAMLAWSGHHKMRLSQQMNDTLPVAILLLDSAGRCLAANRLSEKFFKSSVAKLRGKTLCELLPEIAPPVLETYLAQTRESGAVTFQLERRQADYEELFMEVELSPSSDHSGMVQHITAVVSNISERVQSEKRALADQLREKALLSLNRRAGEPLGILMSYAVKQALVLTDSSFGYLYFTEDSYRWLESEKDAFPSDMIYEFKGKKLIRFANRDEDWEEFLPFMDKLQARILDEMSPVLINNRIELAKVLEEQSITLQHLERLLIIPVFEGAEIVALAGVGNSSSRYKSYDNTQLGLLMAGFWTAMHRKRRERAVEEKEAAEATSTAKSTFIATMSHEIRTPMNAIIGFTDLLAKSELNAKQRDYLDTVRQSSKSLLFLLDSLLVEGRIKQC
jgi:PAS domain S-box-containing protein